MSKNSWQENLKAALLRLTTVEHLPRVAFMGIGHELCGDDAAGVRVAAALKPILAYDHRFLVLEAGPAPENFTSPLRRFQPDLVVLIDSALMDETPGKVRWLDWQETEGMSASTHTLPLHILASYLTAELGCTIGLIGIQPGQTFADAPLTRPVQAAADEVVAALPDCIGIKPALVAVEFA
jgi:hydrogenase 3 maturation protease